MSETLTRKIEQVRYYSEETAFIVMNVQTVELERPVLMTGYMPDYNLEFSYKFEGEFIVLVVIFSNIDIKTVAADIMEWFADKPLLLFSTFTADIAVFHHFFFNLIQVFFFFRNIESGHNGF